MRRDSNRKKRLPRPQGNERGALPQMRQGNSRSVGLIIAYVGRGKGKTSACIGQAIRGIGSGLSVAFGQFMKRPGKAGEQALLEKLLGDNFFAAGAGFFRSPRQKTEQREKALETLNWARTRYADMLVLDEALLALERGLLEQTELETFMRASRSPERHLVLSGPRIPDWLFPLCDIATEMRQLAHAHERGVKAICGIEF